MSRLWLAALGAGDSAAAGRAERRRLRRQAIEGAALARDQLGLNMDRLAYQADQLEQAGRFQQQTADHNAAVLDFRKQQYADGLQRADAEREANAAMAAQFGLFDEPDDEPSPMPVLPELPEIGPGPDDPGGMLSTTDVLAQAGDDRDEDGLSFADSRHLFSRGLIDAEEHAQRIVRGAARQHGVSPETFQRLEPALQRQLIGEFVRQGGRMRVQDRLDDRTQAGIDARAAAAQSAREARDQANQEVADAVAEAMRSNGIDPASPQAAMVLASIRLGKGRADSGVVRNMTGTLTTAETIATQNADQLREQRERAMQAMPSAMRDVARNSIAQAEIAVQIAVDQLRAAEKVKPRNPETIEAAQRRVQQTRMQLSAVHSRVLDAASGYMTPEQRSAVEGFTPGAATRPRPTNAPAAGPAPAGPVPPPGGVPKATGIRADVPGFGPVDVTEDDIDAALRELGERATDEEVEARAKQIAAQRAAQPR